MKKNTYSSEYKSFSKRLREARKGANLTQKEVAEKMGKTQSYISKVEKSDLRIDVVQLKEFAELYNKGLDYFIK